MYALDFEYDGQYLSDYGFIICSFGGSSGTDTASAGSTVTFNKVSRHSGKKYGLTSTQYDECIEATFCIGKDPSIYGKDNMQITNDEYRDLMRWLNRREFLKFQLLGGDDYDGETCYYEASFNIGKIKIDEILCGMELTMITNKPFGYGQEQSITWNVSDTTKPYILSDISDEIGYTYPSMVIEINSNGNLSLHNEMENCTMVINNCKVGEIITIDGDTQIIKSSYDSHHIYDDFNFEFFRIGNTISSRSNKLTCSLQCKIEFKYSPIIKDSV